MLGVAMRANQRYRKEMKKRCPHIYGVDYVLVPGSGHIDVHCRECDAVTGTMGWDDLAPEHRDSLMKLNNNQITSEEGYGEETA